MYFSPHITRGKKMLKYKYELIAVTVAFAFVAVFHGKVLLSPNDYLITGNDDGLRNYFMFASHIKNSEKCFEVSAMNYPYGEFVLLDDIHPALVLLVKFISPALPFVETHSVALINLLLLLSIVVSSFFLFLVYRHFKVKPALAIVGSIAATSLCSQVLLWGHGHWALGYICAFPMGWYLVIRLLNDSAITKWSVFIAVHTVLWFYIHPYMGLILLLFSFLCLIANQVSGYRKLRFLPTLALTFVFPLLFYVLSIQLFDGHSNRPEPFFIDKYVATVHSLFVSNDSPFQKLFELLNLSHSGSMWDRVGNYIGLSTMLVLSGFIVFRVFALFSRKLKVHQEFKSEWAVYWISAIFVLLFAMAIPFKLWSDVNMGFLSVLQQFTGYGRFAWVFYFVATSFSVYVLSKYFSNNKLQMVVSFVLLGMLLTEGAWLHRKIASTATHSKNVFHTKHLGPDQLALTRAVEAEQYQAVISLPFYYDFSNPYRFEWSDQSIYNSMVFGYHTGLPLVNAFLPRPSLSEARKIMQLFSPPHYEKEIERDLPSKQPFLIITTHEELNTRETELLQRSKLLMENDFGKLYHISYDQLFNIQSAHVFDEFRLLLDSVRVESEYYATGTGDVIHLDFEELESTSALFGNGALSKPNSGQHIIYTYSPDATALDQDFVLSFWYYNNNIRQGFANIELEITNGNPDEVISRDYYNPFQSGVIFGEWILVEIPFRLKESQRAILKVNIANPIKDRIFIDELLIRPADVDVYREVTQDGIQFVLKNNYVYSSQVK